MKISTNIIRKYVGSNKYTCSFPFFNIHQKLDNNIKNNQSVSHFNYKTVLSFTTFNKDSESNKDEINSNNFSLNPHWIGIEQSNVYKQVVKEQKKIDYIKKNGENNEYLSISKRSKLMKYIIRLRKKSNFRKKNNAFFVKGTQTIINLSKDHNLTMEVILSNSKPFLKYFQNKCNKLYYVNNDILNYIFLDSLKFMKDKNYDSVAIVKIPNIENTKTEKKIKFLLALDRIRYAYNLGKILNIAYSMNIDSIFYIHNTVDPYNHNVMDITKGKHLFIPYNVGSYNELNKFCEQNNLVPIVAHTNGMDPQSFLKNLTNQGICLILGNESYGPHKDIFSFAKPICLPMHEMTNSLNVSVAAGILIHYLKNAL
ncbi:RNA methyltransferase, putative [Plasmodium yoelii]|uniref:RNA methyltransferase n=2 Tax=Plasmodium yoelii TaxID=5861 RepID=A0AAE9WVT8_PLAYO|nr:RNA methyltransferase, putative [Plasmodium yoelii]WBY59480.1 RNA methyltransferase [Plasmodium yoelii yoelii]CDU19598.1 RNA methyltransferase, putative [Plasmodium yoelii]VTZ80234.1 RNA methyltransferase, putative [Plasmodium yoelii]|eukprot:XP_022812732.1 RNA methyltransferase, putative [Plasmodium yoelii]